jgi:hypothetical protein
LRFYTTTAGQPLVLPEVREIGDYQKVADVWSQLQEQPTNKGSGELGAYDATYNYRLTPDKDDLYRDSALEADWGGAEVDFVEEGETFLCTGDASKCPTPMMKAAAIRGQQLKKLGPDAVTKFQKWYDDGAQGEIPVEIKGEYEPLKREDVKWGPVEDDAFFRYVSYVSLHGEIPLSDWSHTCDGILKKFEGHEICWVACTAFQLKKASQQLQDFVDEIPVLDTAAISGPGIDVGDWKPGDTDEYRKRNEKHIDKMISGSKEERTAAVVVGGDIVLIGVEQDRAAAEYVRQQTIEKGKIPFEEGQIRVSQPFKKFLVSGISPRNHDIVIDELHFVGPGRFSHGWTIEFLPVKEI